MKCYPAIALPNTALTRTPHIGNRETFVRRWENHQVTDPPRTNGDQTTTLPRATDGVISRQQNRAPQDGRRRNSGAPALHLHDARTTVTRPGSTLGRDDRQEPAGATSDGRNGITDDEGFTLVSRRRPRRRSIITGSKSGTTLRSVAQVRNIKVFISR